MIIESISDCYGVDTSALIPSRDVRALYLRGAVNRSMEKLINKTRPPLIEIPLRFQSKAEEYTFRNAAISGMKFYEGEYPLFSSFLIISVGDRIMAGYIKPNFIEFFTIYIGINPEWMKAFYCQALNILTYNNDSDPGLYWTGDITAPMKNIYDSVYVKDGNPMKVSNVACYAHGRIFYASQSAIYASDWIYSQGLGIEKREAVLSNKESTYPSSGDGFGAPSEMGRISSIIAIPQSESLNGHGDVLTGCRNGWFSIAPNRKLRNEWTADPEMQKHILAGKGCASHDSLAIFANQILYRDSMGEVSSLRGDIAAYQSGSEFQSVSSQVDEYTEYDYDSPNITFAQSVTTRKRFLTTVLHSKEASSHMGTHRYSMGLISSVLQKKNGRQMVSWEGLWTGPRVTAMVSTNIGHNHHTIIASFDTDKQNRLYRLNESALGDDYVNGSYKRIKSSFNIGGLFFDKEANSQIVLKSLEKVEGFFIDSDVTKVSVTYTTNGQSNHFPIGVQLTEIVGCGRSVGRFLSDDVCSSQDSLGGQSGSAYFFNLHVEAEGQMQLAKLAIKGSENSVNGFDDISCSKSQSASFNACFTNSKCNNQNNKFTYLF